MSGNREVFSNNATTTLSSSITSSATSISVASASAFPSTGNFRLLCGTEIMLCTAVSGNTFTVVRGQEGTTAASQTSGTTISQIVTLGSFTRSRIDDFHLSYGSQPPVGRLYDASGNVLTSSSFSIVNNVSATITDAADGTIVARVPAQSGTNNNNVVSLLRTIPSTPYSLVAALQYMFVPHNFGTFRTGLTISDGTKFLCSNVYLGSSGPACAEISEYSSATSSPSPADYLDSLLYQSLYLWLKIADDGTNLTFYRSPDGQNWLEDFQVGRTSYLTPAYVGLFLDNATQVASPYAAIDAVCTFAAYQEQT